MSYWIDNKLEATNTDDELLLQQLKETTTAHGLADKERCLPPLLEVLIASGGSASTANIYCQIHNKIGHTFVADDWKSIGNENYRWQNVVRWSYQDLKRKGLISYNDYQEVWVVTGFGRLHIEHNWRI